MDGGSELAALARRERTGGVSELPPHNFLELIFDVFPVV
jgi:hypothetical protein